MNSYFVHESSYIDENVQIGKELRSGIFVIFKAVPGLEKIALWGRM